MSTTPTDEPVNDDWTPDLGVADLGGPTLQEVLDDGEPPAIVGADQVE